jgi:hypothetical protein
VGRPRSLLVNEPLSRSSRKIEKSANTIAIKTVLCSDKVAQKQGFMALTVR